MKNTDTPIKTVQKPKAENKTEIKFGVEAVDLSKGADPLAAADVFARGRGVDGVLLTLSSSNSDAVAAKTIATNVRT